MRSTEIKPEMDGERVIIAGWVHEVRDLGGLVFIVIRDRDGFIQITLPKKTVNLEMFKKAKKISRESVIKVEGIVKREDKAPNGFEIIPDIFEILSESHSPLPLEVTEKVPADLETRLDNRFMDLRRPKVSSIFRIKSQISKSIRDFLSNRGFIEVHTPKIVSTATEGGTELFPISYFEREAFLNQSPQLYKQILMSAGLEKVFEIGPIFRAEEHNTTRHLNEATSVDIEMSFVDHEGVMEILEEMVKKVYGNVIEKCEKQLKTLEIELEVPKTPFKRITYTEAIKILENKIPWGEDLDLQALKTIGNEIGGFYFITEWPTKIKPFYVMPFEDDRICKSFDLMYGYIEIASGAQREHRYEKLLENIKRRNLYPESFEFYLKAFRYGIPPHAGWGLGLERLIMAMLGLSNIREAMLFPRDRTRLVP
ncbi:MAG: aspartate--tRNA(Asn) ligase [Archaeoglobaceae archaeon]|nr:aspartate--tRNA(Asn) ligase [Archaeoglobaceae archaeon]MDW7990063.1 aspartate--tRNA(Asn) ligase [Archaeoglobaceae archaeon]